MLEQILLAFALMLFIEGTLYALFPQAMRKAIAAALAAPVQSLRVSGLAAMAIGVAVVWLIKGI